MDQIKQTIAKNISELRTAAGLTQAQLAEKLHYSDKAVSKWERGDSVPEIGTLTAIADLFGVQLDYLVREEHKTKPDISINALPDRRKRVNHSIITGMSVLLVWFVALFAYILTDIISSNVHNHWIAFAYAVPASMVVWLVFNSIWFNRKTNYFIISLLMWSILATIHITFFVFNINIWQIYALGIPGQIVILLWSRLRFKK